MRIFVRIFFLLAISAIVALAGATIKDGSLQAHSDGNDVTIQWGTTQESLVQEFVVERLGGTETDFVAIGSVAPKGSNSYYEFVDQTAFKATTSVYQYRIEIVAQDGTTYSQVVTVAHNVSSVKRTWGSLKAMFR
ncbi:MAG: hypothetical protein WBW71_05320 [Bacteroidota bacterium]